MPDKDAILKQLTQLLKACHASLHRMKSEAESIPAIEWALFEQKLIALYDQVQLAKGQLSQDDTTTKATDVDVDEELQRILHESETLKRSGQPTTKEERPVDQEDEDAPIFSIEFDQDPPKESKTEPESEPAKPSALDDDEKEASMQSSAENQQYDEQHSGKETQASHSPKVKAPADTSSESMASGRDEKPQKSSRAEDEQRRKQAQKPDVEKTPHTKSKTPGQEAVSTEDDKRKNQAKEVDRTVATSADQPDAKEEVKTEGQPNASEKSDEKAEEEKGENLNTRLSKGERLSLHEKLAARHEKQKEVSARFSGRPISDIKKAIGLNQQVLYTKKLFGGDKKGFKKAIDFVNRSKNFSEAKSYLQYEVMPKYGWEEEDALYQDLLATIKRKFA